MPLKPEISIPAALATATIVYTIQGRGLPPLVDIRANEETGDEIVETVRKQNAWMAAGTVAAVSLIAKDPVIFIVGGSMVIALDWLTRMNNFTSPLTNKVDRHAGGGSPAAAEAISPDVSTINFDVLSAVS